MSHINVVSHRYRHLIRTLHYTRDTITPGWHPAAI
jgi:hypothetical protein